MPKRATSDRVSRIAGKVLAALGDEPGKRFLTQTGMGAWDFVCSLRVSELKALAASCLAQDETKGKRPKKARVRRA